MQIHQLNTYKEKKKQGCMQQDWKKVQFNNFVTALLFLEDIINL